MQDSRNLSTRWALFAVALLLLVPAAWAQVDVTVELSGNMVPGGLVTARADVDVLDGSTVQGIAWRQVEGATAVIGGADRRVANVRLAPQNAYRQELAHRLSEPAGGEAHGPFHAGLQDRFQVVGINPFALEEAALVKLEVEVTTTSGTYHGEAEIHAALPWRTTTGVRNVPVGVPVLLYGKDQASYNWRLTPPAGSSATLAGKGSRMPEFTPDVPGLYQLQVRDTAAGAPVTLEVYAGTWRGVIVTKDANDRPIAEGLCVACHSTLGDGTVFDKWANTGHAEIFSANLDTSTHYSASCFGCHTVGHDEAVKNGGCDDAPDYDAFMGAGFLNNPGDNWTAMLEDFPEMAQLANIQCENCHGPQESGSGLDTLAHGWRPAVTDTPRVSLSSDVCASCHGEPLRHARFQQWQLSGHGNYELAIEEGMSGSCTRCHTANGFVAWMQGEVPGDPNASIDVTWKAEDIHPQTCVTCHDPHDIGTTSGDGTNAKMRLTGETPELSAGFKAVGVGKGAICMTCHNSRRGLRNDLTFAETLAAGDIARAPHVPTQTDVLMGENAYFVNAGVRGAHSFVQDTCVGCHMRATEPPASLSNNAGGTNHTFAAGVDICADCHGEVISAEVVQDIVGTVMDDVQGLIETEWMRQMTKLINMGNVLDLGGEMLVDDATMLKEVVFGESHGRQALTVVLRGGAGTFGPLRITDVDVVQPLPLPKVSIDTMVPPTLFQAGWNWILVHSDGSLGVHNPTFALAVLDGARDAVGGRGGPRTRLPF